MSGFSIASMYYLYAHYISFGDYTVSMNLNLYLNILLCTVYLILCMYLYVLLILWGALS